ncbi:hypothetical protein BHM03_00058642 [Ensete ventricosum]|nr:hypothetical protein BHM03_00058642 [Ensete ventricosum]
MIVSITVCPQRSFFSIDFLFSRWTRPSSECTITVTSAPTSSDTFPTLAVVDNSFYLFLLSNDSLSLTSKPFYKTSSALASSSLVRSTIVGFLTPLSRHLPHAPPLSLVPTVASSTESTSAAAPSLPQPSPATTAALSFGHHLPSWLQPTSPAAPLSPTAVHHALPLLPSHLPICRLYFMLLAASPWLPALPACHCYQRRPCCDHCPRFLFLSRDQRCHSLCNLYLPFSIAVATARAPHRLLPSTSSATTASFSAIATVASCVIVPLLPVAQPR